MTELEDGIGDWGETTVHALAERAGFLVHSPTKDRRGWDRHFEIDVEAAPTDSFDKRSRSIRAFAQVKTTRRSGDFPIKLDLLERAAKDLAPWFFVVVVLDAKNSTAGLHVVPMDNKFIELVLKRLRRESSKGSDVATLRRKTQTLRWRDTERIAPHDYAHFRRLVLTHIGDVANYARRKQQLLETIGYPERRNRVRVTLAPHVSRDQLADVMVGTRDEIAISMAEIEEERFGIRLQTGPASDGGSIRFEPSSIGKTRLTAMDESGLLRSVELQTYVTPTALPRDLQRIRCTNRFLSLTVQPDRPLSCEIAGLESTVPLAELGATARFLLALESNPRRNDIEVRTPGGAPLRLRASDTKVEFVADASLLRVLRAADQLMAVLTRFGHDHPEDEVVVDELLANSERIAAVHTAVCGPAAGGATTVHANVPTNCSARQVEALLAFGLPLRARVVSCIFRVFGEATYEPIDDTTRRMTVASAPVLVAVRSFDRSDIELSDQLARFREDVFNAEAARFAGDDDAAVMRCWR